MIEVLVTGMQRQVVLQNKRCEPHVVRRNRCALLPELMKHRGVMVGRLIIGTEEMHAVLQDRGSRIVAGDERIRAKFPAPQMYSRNGAGLFERRAVSDFLQIDWVSSATSLLPDVRVDLTCA